MTEFGGWEMPVSYRGLRDEHQAVRTGVGLFDISHMGEIEIRGTGAQAATQYLTCNNVRQLPEGKCQYSALLTPGGTFVDDIIVYPLATDHYLLCVNASNTEKDFAWLEQQSLSDVTLTNVSAEWAQLALQGPRAATVLSKVIESPLDKLGRFNFRKITWQGNALLLSRTGYTGEDGFELYLPLEGAVPLWRALLAAGQEEGIQPCGLGARDTLRLEAGFPLYGHEIDETIDPFEAGLEWIVKLEGDDFIGKETLRQKNGTDPQKRLVGFTMEDRSIPREGYPLYRGEKVVGEVASGTFSPTLECGIGTGLITGAPPAPDDKIAVDIRGKKRKATIIKLPFYRKTS